MKFQIFPKVKSIEAATIRAIGKEEIIWVWVSKRHKCHIISEIVAKGQLISKPIYGLLTSPKKRTDEFDLFAFLLFTANKSNPFVHFFGESTVRQSALWN